jgi:hypothetical protein
MNWVRLLAVFGFFCAFNLHAAASRPNILWLVAEDFGQHLGCYGTREVSSPNQTPLPPK